MRAALLAQVLVAAVSGGCGDRCAPSANVRVTLTGPTAAMAGAQQLLIELSIDGAAAQRFTLELARPLVSGQTILLQPTTMPANASYAVQLTITTRQDDGTAIARGAVSGTARVSACNELQLTLATIGGDRDLSTDDTLPGGDDGGGVDASLVDAAHPVDLQACPLSTPDEDGDGQADACDVCAANPEPAVIADSDGDGLPDACDPRPMSPGDGRLAFEGFDAAPGGWSTTGASAPGASAQLAGGTWTLQDAQGTSVMANGASALPLSLMQQVIVLGQQNYPYLRWTEMRLFAWSSVGTDGYACALAQDATLLPTKFYIAGAIGTVNGDPDLNSAGDRAVVQVPSANVSASVPGRLRMMIVGSTMVCEWAALDGSNPTTITRMLPTAPKNQLYGGFGVSRKKAAFSSYFASTDH